jgi:hypothetical protein
MFAAVKDGLQAIALAARSVLDRGEHSARLGQFGSCGSGAVLEAPALVAGFNDVAMVDQAVEQRCRHLGVAEHARPFAEREVRCHDDRGLLVKPTDQMEQQLSAGLGEWQVAELVEDDEVLPIQ